MITLVTHYTPSYKSVADITIPVMKQYCDKHGYKLDAIEVPDYKKYNGQIKIKQVMDNLHEYGDIVFSLDADCLITNFSKKVEDYISEEKYFIICEGLNMGAFIIKNNFTSYFLMMQLSWYILIERCCDCEQDAFEKVFNEKYETYGNIISVLKHPAFNSFLSELYPEIEQPKTEQQGQWVKGSYILHLPGLSINQRVSIFNEIKEQIVYGN